MRVAVIGGTGNIGQLAVKALRLSGHDPVVVARSLGVDVLTGENLEPALADVEAVIDVTNTAVSERDAAREFFSTSTQNLLRAEERVGARHHVVLSIVNVDKIEGNAHYEGKRVQEEVALAGPLPTTVVRATQFHDFAAMVVGWTRQRDVATIAPLLVQPIAPADVADVLVRTALGAPEGRARDIAGPETQDLVDMARRTLVARGESVRLVPTWRGLFGLEMSGEALLPGEDAWLASTTFDEWLASGGATAS